MTKRTVNLILSVCMILSTIFPALSEISYAAEENIQQKSQIVRNIEFENQDNEDLNQNSDYESDTSVTTLINPEDIIFDRENGTVLGIENPEGIYEGYDLKIEIPAEIDGTAVRKIDSLAFFELADLVEADFSKAVNLTEIGDYAFAFSGLRKIDLSKAESLKNIKTYAFFGAPLDSILLPEGKELERIEKCAFGNSEMTYEELDYYFTEYESERPELHTDGAVAELDFSDEKVFLAFDDELAGFIDRKNSESSENDLEISDSNSKIINENNAEKESSKNEIKKKKFIEEISMNEITDGPIGLRLMNSPRMLMRSLRNGENLWRVYPDITSGVYVEGQNMRINEIAVVENKDEGTGVRYLEWNLQVEHMQAPNQNEYWGMMITQPQGEGEDTVWIPFTPNSASTESGGAMTPVNGYYKGPAIPQEAGDSQSEIFKIRTEVPEWDKTLKFKFVKLDADGNLLEGTSVEQDFKTQRPIPDKIKVNIPGYTGDVTLGIQGAELEIPYTVRMRDGAGYLYETGAVKGTEVRLEAPEGYEIVSPEGGRAIVQRNDESGEHYLNYSIRKITNPAEMLWKFRVTDIDGNPVEGASVKVTDLDGKVLEGISRVDGLTEVKGMFIDDNFTRFNIEVCKAGYHTDDKPVYYSSSESSIKLAIAESKPSQFNIAVRDSEDNSAVTGTVLSVTDDLGNVLTGEVSAEGTVSFNGNFTPCMPYDIKTVSVPEGYYRPDIQKVKYEESESDPAVSEIQIIKLKKAPVVPGEVKIKTNLSDADVTVDIYRGSEISGTPLLSDVSIPRNETVSLYDFEENQIYTLVVKGVSDEAKYGRNIGLAKNFVYEFTNPEELITLEEYPESASGELRIRIYEESRLGPLTKRLNGRRIVLEDSQSEDYFATIQNGEAVFTGLTPGETYRVKGVPLFKKYSIVKNDEITIGEEGNFEDWIIVKKSSTVYLTVKAPQARAFPDDMTVKIADPSNNRVIAGPVKVENGILKFDNIPQGKIFNFVYDNVPEKWTHEYNGKTPFYAEENSSSVTVNDYFECGETASENSILSIYVRDRDGSPVSGYSFKLKDSQGNLIEPELTTGYDGRAVHEFIPKLEGKYTLVNTAAKEGYNSINVKDVLDFTEKSSEGVEITVSQSSPEHSNIYITVLDENERPVTDKQLKLYKTKNGVIELVDGELQTNHEGRVNLTGITVDEEAVYSFVLEEGDDSYSLNPQESENIRFSNGTDENIIFHLRTNSEYGKINISTKTVKGDNAPFVNFVIYKGEEEIYRGKTNFAGNYTTDFLKIGQYRVEIDPDDSYNELAEIDKVKNVNIISNGIYPAEFNKLKKKYIYISDAGDIEIIGADMYETRNFFGELTTYTDTPICSKLSHMDVKIDKYQNEGHICELLGHYGSVILSGKYSEDGTAINWNLNSSYDRVEKAIGDAKWANVRYELQFVDKNGNPIENLADIGLSTDHTVVRTTNGEVASIDGALTVNDSKTNYVAKGIVYANNVDNLTITTPLLEDGPFPKDYRLKITGWMDPEGSPSQESIGECVATVEGKKLTVNLEKNWKNIEEDSVLPEAEFVLYQRNMDGLVKKMETKTLPETDIANIPSGSPYEKLYDENGFKGAVGKVIFTEQPAFDDAGNRYFYFVEESPLDGYNIAKTVEGKRDEQISITNTKRNKYKEQKDPTKYTADNEGVYPEDYRQDSKDVRNAKTEFDKSLLDENKVPLGNDGTPYKIDYEDAIIGKRAVETDIPGEFDMELTIEGKTDGSGNGTISNGIVKDPMGTYLNIKDTNGDGEITHTVTGFQDGDIILEAQDQSLLDGVTVSYINDADNDKEGFEISNISLKSGESIKVRYKVRLDSDMFGYTAGVYYQTNGTTTLQPRPGAPQEEHPEILRYFPIPSVKGTSKSIGVRKRWEVGGSEITGTAVEDLTAAFKLLRYTAKDPYQKDLPSQIDENVEPLEVTISELTKDNNMETVYEGLTAFNSEGKEYIYKWVEEPSAIGRHERWELKRDREGRPVTKTLIGGQEVLYTRYIFDKENGGRFEGPVSAEEGTAVSKGPLLRTEFTNEYLYEEKLPVTGGLGVDIYRIGGFILLAIGTTAVYSKKKNQKLKKDNNQE